MIQFLQSGTVNSTTGVAYLPITKQEIKAIDYEILGITAPTSDQLEQARTEQTMNSMQQLIFGDIESWRTGGGQARPEFAYFITDEAERQRLANDLRVSLDELAEVYDFHQRNIKRILSRGEYKKIPNKRVRIVASGKLEQINSKKEASTQSIAGKKVANSSLKQISFHDIGNQSTFGLVSKKTVGTSRRIKRANVKMATANANSNSILVQQQEIPVNLDQVIVEDSDNESV